MTKPLQIQAELEIFREFAAAHGDIDLSSIERRADPEPDIRCVLLDGSQLAFELTQLVDNQSIARPTGADSRFRDHLAKERARLQGSLQPKFGNARIVLWPSDLSRSRSAIPRLLSWLAQQPCGIAGDLNLEQAPEIKQHFCRVTIDRRSSFQSYGPFFTIRPVPAGSYGDPAVDGIQKKFCKSYTTNVPIELLAFLHLQPTPLLPTWLETQMEFIHQGLSSSPFQRVWLYSCCEHRILAVSPQG